MPWSLDWKPHVMDYETEILHWPRVDIDSMIAWWCYSQVTFGCLPNAKHGVVGMFSIWIEILKPPQESWKPELMIKSIYFCVMHFINSRNGVSVMLTWSSRRDPKCCTRRNLQESWTEPFVPSAICVWQVNWPTLKPLKGFGREHRSSQHQKPWLKSLIVYSVQKITHIPW